MKKLYVVFSLNKQEYGIEISFAQEILRIPDNITHIPNMPNYVDGIFSLREDVIPILNLKKRFGLQLTNQDADSRLLVVNIKDNIIGFIVDDVDEIVQIDESSIDSLESISSKIGKDSVKGIGKIEERLILLLDLSKLENEIYAHTYSDENELCLIAD